MRRIRGLLGGMRLTTPRLGVPHRGRGAGDRLVRHRSPAAAVPRHLRGCAGGAVRRRGPGAAAAGRGDAGVPPERHPGRGSDRGVAAGPQPARRRARRAWSGATTCPGRPYESDPGVLPRLSARAPRYANAGNARARVVRPRGRRGGGCSRSGRCRCGSPTRSGWSPASTPPGETSQLIVTPEVVPLGETGLAVPAGDGEARIVQRRSVGDADDTITREYRRGDALRRVHWRASARKGDLMVRQEEQRSYPEARIIVDTLRSGYSDVDPTQADDEGESLAFEWAVRMLASVTVHLRRSGFPGHRRRDRRPSARRCLARPPAHLGRRGVPRPGWPRVALVETRRRAAEGPVARPAVRRAEHAGAGGGREAGRGSPRR